MRKAKTLMAIALVCGLASAAIGSTVQPVAGPFVLNLTNADSGTNYANANDGIYVDPGFTDLTGNSVGAVPGGVAGPGAVAGEDTWGVFKVDTIRPGIVTSQNSIGDAGPFWFVDGGFGSNGKELVGIFYGGVDIALDKQGNTQLIEAIDMKVVLIEQDAGTFGNMNVAEQVPSRRGANPWDYTGIDLVGGNILLTMETTPGFVGTIAAEAEFQAEFTPTAIGAGGSASAFFQLTTLDLGGLGNVTGEWNPLFDTDWFVGTGNARADIRLEMNTEVENLTNQGDVFTVSSDDDTTGIIVPEPMTMGALGMAIAGLGGYIRRRRR